IIIYYCIADFAELSPHHNEMVKSERAVIEMSDLIFAQSPELAARCARGGKTVEIFPFGVTMNRFTKTNGHRSPGEVASATSASTFSASLRRPIIGYVGGIHKFLDLEMLTAMARVRPDWSWVLVGPLQTSSRELNRLPNVHLTGPKAHEELP